METYSDANQYINIDKDEQQIIKNLDSIYQSIQNIVSTPKGSRAFLPEFGSNIWDMLFELNNQDTRDAILTEIYGAILRWEPRVKMIYNKSDVTISDIENHKYTIVIVFEVLGFNQEQYVLELNMTPGA